jgi:trimeric autotransporter adhesin
MSDQIHITARSTRAIAAAAGLLAASALAAPAAAQCTPEWDTSIGNPGLGSGYVQPIFTWNDGTGEKVYVGGSFQGIAGTGASYAASYNPSTGAWSALGGGIRGGFTNAFITSFTTFDPDGAGERLIVGGFYDNAAGVPETASLAMWDGSQWEAMGTTWTGTTRGSIWSMAQWNGRLYVGGGIVNQPPMIAGLPWAGIASWDGNEWRSHASSVSGFSPGVFTMQVFDDGSGEALYIGGRFNDIAGAPGTSLIARWDGEGWSSVGGGLAPGSTTQGLESMFVYDDGSGPALYVTGFQFTPPGQPPANVAKWDGSQWTTVGPLIGGRITSSAIFDDGTGPAIHVGKTGAGSPVKFTGSSWDVVGGGADNNVFGLRVIDGDLWVGGSFNTVGGQFARGLAIRTGCPSCYADCDGSGELDFFDFLCFQNAFAAGDPYADCDGSGSLDVFDFLCFQNEFAAGCP